MGVFYHTDNLPEFKNAVVTIGTFDGVHLGHQAILQTVIDKAIEMQGESIVITFHPHPRKLLFPHQELKMLTPLEDKISLLKNLGIDHIVVVPFTTEFSNLSAEQYIHDFLVDQFHPHTIVIGYDHHFGSDRKGNIHLLKATQLECNFQLIEIPEQLIDEAGISSTKIRNSLQTGDVREAAMMMGRGYSLKGTVITGNQLGRTIGYPTANLSLTDTDQLLPCLGIYCVQVRYKEELLGGMLSIGYNPTVTDQKTIKIEVHLFDFDRDIYGDALELIFIQYMRGEQKFESVQALTAQLKKDEVMAKSILKSL
ncbi:MAG TPA: bifunctional riboflavin kinase/FAD synthetase [Flavipsychrobacter sp.]|nr:bifunctional riboflavin kinase/FAD synthetase [Flavipsychrobacter sp.]